MNDLGSASWAFAFATVRTIVIIPNAAQSEVRVGLVALGTPQVRSNTVVRARMHDEVHRSQSLQNNYALTYVKRCLPAELHFQHLADISIAPPDVRLRG